MSPADGGGDLGYQHPFQDFACRISRKHFHDDQMLGQHESRNTFALATPSGDSRGWVAMCKHSVRDGKSMIVKSGKMLCLAVVTLAFAGPTEAEQPTLRDALLDKLLGAWVISGQGKCQFAARPMVLNSFP